jgi:hypothetical protein
LHQFAIFELAAMQDDVVSVSRSSGSSPCTPSAYEVTLKQGLTVAQGSFAHTGAWGGDAASGDGTFKCTKCELDKPMSQMRTRGNQAVCELDVNNYAALAARWKMQKKLKVWWGARTHEEKIAWFRKEQGHCHGNKRSFDDVCYSDITNHRAQSSRLSLYNQIPLSVFIRNKFAEGTQRAQAVLLFEAIVAEHRETCVFENNQWHVPDYGGIQAAVGTVDSSGWQINRSAGAQESAVVLKGLVTAGDAIVAESASASLRAHQPLLPGKPMDYPSIVRNPADQTAAIKMPQALMSEMFREVV